MTRKSIWLACALGLVLLLLTAGCPKGSSDSGGSEEMEIRSYTVPKGLDEKELASKVAASLRKGDDTLGRVTSFGDGTLVVTAPASLQKGVGELMERLARAGPATPAPTLTVTIDYWLVLGQPAAGPEGAAAGQPDAKGLSEVAPALEEIRKAQGPMRFRLLEKQRLTSLVPGDPSRMRGRYAEVDQDVRTLGSGQVLADVRIGVESARIATRVKLEPGKLIILGESGFRGGSIPGVDPTGKAEDLMIYYVLSADIH
jgi:hypothetical protein